MQLSLLSTCVLLGSALAAVVDTAEGPTAASSSLSDLPSLDCDVASSLIAECKSYDIVHSYSAVQSVCLELAWAGYALTHTCTEAPATGVNTAGPFQHRDVETAQLATSPSPSLRPRPWPLLPPVSRTASPPSIKTTSSLSIHPPPWGLLPPISRTTLSTSVVRLQAPRDFVPLTGSTPKPSSHLTTRTGHNKGEPNYNTTGSAPAGRNPRRRYITTATVTVVDATTTITEPAALPTVIKQADGCPDALGCTTEISFIEHQGTLTLHRAALLITSGICAYCESYTRNGHSSLLLPFAVYSTDIEDASTGVCKNYRGVTSWDCASLKTAAAVVPPPVAATTTTTAATAAGY